MLIANKYTISLAYSNYLRIVFIIVSFFIIQQSQAQTDSTYIQVFKNKVSLGARLGAIQSSFNLNNSNHKYFISSNFVPSVGVWFKLKKWPSIAIGIPVNFTNPEKFARTTGLRIDLNGQIANRLLVDGYFYFLRGFNLRKLDQLNIVTPLKNTINLNASFELYYIANYKKYSHKNAYLFGEIQKKSAGSFSGGMAIGLNSLSNAIPIFSTTDSTFNSLNFKSVSTISVAFVGGYMHTIVFGRNKKWYINGAGMIGPNIHFGTAHYYAIPEPNEILNLALNIKYKASMGYRVNKWSLRIISTGNFIGYRPDNDTYINNNSLDIKLSGIYKF